MSGVAGCLSKEEKCELDVSVCDREVSRDCSWRVSMCARWGCVYF